MLRWVNNGDAGAIQAASLWPFIVYGIGTTLSFSEKSLNSKEAARPSHLRICLTPGVVVNNYHSEVFGSHRLYVWGRNTLVEFEIVWVRWR